MFILNYIVSRRDQTNDIHFLSGIHLERFECNRFGVDVLGGGKCRDAASL